MRETPTHTPDGRPYRMFFISGHMRSGTTWLANLLNLHPDVNAQSEGPLKTLARVVGEASRAPWLSCSRDEMPKLLHQLFVRLGIDYTLALSRYKPDAQWIGDHTSGHIHPFIPRCPHFNIIRDGRDVLTSWTFHQLRHRFLLGEPFRSEMAGLIDALHKNPNHFAKNPHELFSHEGWVRSAARGWSQVIVKGMATTRRIEAGELPGTTICTMRYERCLDRTAVELRRMYEFLGLDPALAMSPSDDTRTRPGFSNSSSMDFFRSGKVGDWKNYATDNFRRWFKEEAGEALVLAGYERDLQW